MKKVIAEEIVNCGSEDISLVEDYSGRGMYGAITCGIIAPDFNTFIRSLIEATLAAPEIMEEAVEENFRTDNMGLDIIVY